MEFVPDSRLTLAVDRPPRTEGAYVLYWMTSNRRPTYNFAMDQAVAWALELGRPLLVFEALRCGYKWASDRLHRFVMQGMADNAAYFAERDITYFPYLEPAQDAGKGLLAALGRQACVVVGDDYPCFFVPRMLQRAADALKCRLELVDSNGLLPIHTPKQTFPTAYAFRRYLQKELPNHLLKQPSAQPLRQAAKLKGARLPDEVRKRWPAAPASILAATPEALSKFPIDHEVGIASFDGGHKAGDARARDFVRRKLSGYADNRNHPDADASSGLSPYLHWGHLSVHALFAQLCRRDEWDITELGETTQGKREGWWGMRPETEAFLDEVITWREIGQNMCVQRPDDYDQYESLPDWAKKTLREHARDKRPKLYTAAQLEAAETDDPVWNAAQNQIIREGTLQNYLRMLWGKKVLEWSKTPQEALQTLIHLNNKYGVDGRDPNSYSGIFWVFGRYDRPWPERPIYGKIRYMTSDSTLRKLKMKTYMEKFAS